jgi:hypothetical protein
VFVLEPSIVIVAVTFDFGLMVNVIDDVVGSPEKSNG